MILVEQISPQQWVTMSENAHLLAFKEKKPCDVDRIDFALLSIHDKIPLGYLTCREHDKDTLYWQFGGAFPSAKDTLLTWRGYEKFAEWSETRYKRVTTLIENNNFVMLKMAMKVGFKIVGVRVYHNQVLLEHLLEFDQVGVDHEG